MPKRGSRDVEGTIVKKKANRPRVASNGHRLPDPIPAGEMLTDVMKRKWKLGRSVGLGGFGEIYLASDNVSNIVGPEASYVIKVEPHSNGPLFAEMHFYHRVGKTEQIDEWVLKKNLDFLGMPRFIGSGSHEYHGVKYRFMVMERFGEDLQKLLNRNKLFPEKTVFTLGIRILDILEYIHSFGYIHADVKGSNLLLGFGKGRENQVYLVDYGLACRYNTSCGIHKEYKEDLRKAHDGTIEFTSRDAHIGAHSRRGDLEILGYNMLQWLCRRLPWEDNLKNPEYVSKEKSRYMSDVISLMKKCFGISRCPEGIQEYMQYVANLNFEEEPNYEHCRQILKQSIKRAGYKDDGKLEFSLPSKLNKANKSPKKRITSQGKQTPKRKQAQRIASSEFADGIISERLRIKKAVSDTPELTSHSPSENILNGNGSPIDNPTPAMIMVMQRKQELQQKQKMVRKSKSFRQPNILHSAIRTKSSNNLNKKSLKNASLRRLSPRSKSITKTSKTRATTSKTSPLASTAALNNSCSPEV
ncbi:serine/threonine-protein kinase VRK1-like isoform X2 [Limulus polyphemus]|uniref:non-specific serine/threonine protein kinase n=1 Tax=Limulus polyphemus TaxID=6850 RepID=A0ABM1SY13_LIMPO|nr:serine/threonine-protein kinase VRK1-like isoform X2 [Limulus polyphemus]